MLRISRVLTAPAGISNNQVSGVHLSWPKMWKFFGKKGKLRQAGGCDEIPCGKKHPRPWYLRMFEDDPKLDPELKEICERHKRGNVILQLPDVSRMRGRKFRTCGPSVLVQEDRHDAPLVAPTECESKERRRLRAMEAHPTLKRAGDCASDRVPPYASHAQRLIDLHDLRLHPLHRKLRSVPKRRAAGAAAAPAQARGPRRVAVDRDALERKNMLADLKRSEAPRDRVDEAMRARVAFLRELERRRLESGGSLSFCPIALDEAKCTLPVQVKLQRMRPTDRCGLWSPCSRPKAM